MHSAVSRLWRQVCTLAAQNVLKFPNRPILLAPALYSAGAPPPPPLCPDRWRDVWHEEATLPVERG